MALATLVPVSGPKKVSISEPTPSKAPRYGLLPHPNQYIPPHINNRYININIVLQQYNVSQRCLFNVKKNKYWKDRHVAAKLH
jgi:hypothetical protein